MNKNLKRALNTTAAVSMSLAMVLGAVAPTTVGAWNEKVTSQSVKFDEAQDFVEAFLSEISDVTSIKMSDTFKFSESFLKDYPVADVDKDLALTITDMLGAGKKVGAATDSDVFHKDTTIAEILEFYVDNFKTYGDEADQDICDAAAHLVGAAGVTHKHINEYVGELETFVTDLKDADTKDGVNAKGEVDVTEYSDVIKGLFKEADKLDAYAGNLADENDTELFNEWFSQVKEVKGDYDAEHEDENLQKYIDQLEDVIVLTVKDGDKTVEITVRDLVEREAEVHYSNASKIERVIKQIKNDDAAGLNAAKYDDVKDEAEVAEMVEGLEAIVKEMKEAKDLLKTTTAEYKDYKKVADKVETLVKAVKGEASSATDGDEDKKSQEELIDDAVTAFRSSDVAKLKTYVEEVFNQFYTVTPRETSRGTYVLRLEKAEYGRYVVETDFDANLRTLLTTPVDKTEGEDSYYDVLVGENATVDELYAAVTEDIEGLTLDSKITSTDAQKIIAAKKALDRLMEENGTFTEEGKKLTYKEQKEVKSNATLIRTLYLKLIINGEVTTIGWVETPQGWEYYDNNGKRVYEGWAPGNGYWSYMKNGYAAINDWCAAKEGWYYMGADGKMVTGKVMINGVEEDFGTDGIWVRK